MRSWQLWSRPKRRLQHADLGPGQSLVSGLVLQSGSSSAPLISELSVVSEDLGVGLQHVVENVEAVRAADLWAPLQGANLGAVKVLVGAHGSQQLQLQGAALLLRPSRTGQLVESLPAALQKLVKSREAGVFLSTNTSILLQRFCHQQSSQLWPLNIREVTTVK